MGVEPSEFLSVRWRSRNSAIKRAHVNYIDNDRYRSRVGEEM